MHKPNNELVGDFPEPVWWPAQLELVPRMRQPYNELLWVGAFPEPVWWPAPLEQLPIFVTAHAPA